MNLTTYKHYLNLTKPGIVRMVMVTAAFGYVLGGHGVQNWIEFVATVLGIGGAAAGSAVLNNFLERDIDAHMDRTRYRELPSGKLDPAHALSFGVILLMASVSGLILLSNLACAFLALLSAFLYVVVYTPLKRRTWLNTSIGAIPGALPISCGWVAATGSFDFGALVVFAILYAWQHPHFYAIAWLYREDYRKAGFQMLSVVDPTGARLFLQVILYACLLLAVSLVPVLIGFTGFFYLVGALALGIFMLIASITFVRVHTMENARRLLRASIIYLPLLFVVVAIDVGM